jgi:ABC-2 type transport system ATP-binding protein
MNLHAIAYGVPRSERAGRVAEALSFVDLSDRKDDLVRNFSGGMKRRLEIARGLVHRPRILFLDEPTTGLDPQTRRKTWEVLRTLRKQYGITLFLTTHYMDEAENCDRIAVIDHGQIVALDTPEALKRRVGKDVVSIRIAEPEPLVRLLSERHGIEANPTDDGICFRTDDGESLVVELIAETKTRVQGVSVHRPTLDDVFLALTGRQIRDEASNGMTLQRTLARGRR